MIMPFTVILAAFSVPPYVYSEESYCIAVLRSMNPSLKKVTLNIVQRVSS